jgi:hypothetical protein
VFGVGDVHEVIESEQDTAATRANGTEFKPGMLPLQISMTQVGRNATALPRLSTWLQSPSSWDAEPRLRVICFAAIKQRHKGEISRKRSNFLG